MNLTSTDEKRGLPCQTTGFGVFSPQSITEFENHVRSIQMKLDKAVANDDKDLIRWYVHLLSKKSRAVKILAIYKVCEVNSGKYTASVDGVAMPRDRTERFRMMERLINEIDITTKPLPIKRAYIPKPNGDKRPLDIPTIKDRIIQEIIRLSIEPICEYHFLSCSYGFRPKRSCQDAMADLFLKLGKRNSKRWIIEGDIKGCFAHIRHRHIISTLKEWHVPYTITDIVQAMLQARIMENLSLTPSLDGTPQGGVISPMLANVALTCLDKEVMDMYGQDNSNPIVRYADDFIITVKNREKAESIKTHIGEYLKERVGLTLSDEKTHITEISDGFDFLGFNFRKYDNKLLIKPSQDNVHKVLRNIKKIFRSTESTTTIIAQLNPIIIGWGNYYRHVVSKKTFNYIDDRIWELTRKWLRKIYGNYEEQQIIGKRLFDNETKKYLNKMASIPIKRFVKVRQDMRVFDENARGYWENREYRNAKDSIYGSATLTQLFRRQKGKCAYCENLITDTQIRNSAIEKHHLKPRSEGGNWKLGNLRLLHAECHNSIHNQYSRKEMADLINKRIDYLRLTNNKVKYEA
jgi:RNA-directed DNA polymerase